MKKCKKITALFTALCMLITMLGGFSAFAEEAENPSGSAADTSISLDFDSFTTNSEVSLSNDDWVVQLRRRTDSYDKSGSDLMTYESVMGSRGKAVDDGAMKMYFQSGTLEANTDPAIFLRCNPTAPIYVENGEYYEVSMDILWEGPGSTKQIRVGIPGDDGSLTGSIAYLLNIDASGKVTSPALRPDNSGALSLSPSYLTAAGSWYNFRFVVKAGENNPTSGLDEDKSYHWIYINGTLVSEGVFTHYDRNKSSQDKITKFRGFSYIWYLINEKTLNSKPSADTEIELEDPSITYLDNLEIAKYDAFPAMTNTKVLDFDSNTVSTDVEAVKADVKANHGYFGNAGYQNLTGDVYQIADGVFGKEAGDHSLFMQKSTEWTHSIDQTQFMDYYEAGYHTGGAVEASVNTNPGDFYEMEISMAWNDETEIKAVQTFNNIDQSGDGKTGGYAISVNALGQVGVLGSVVSEAGKLYPKTWYKFNLVIHAGDNTAEDDADKNWYKLYINDKLVRDRTVFVPSARTNVTVTNEDGTTSTSLNTITYNQFRGFKRYWLTLQTEPKFNPEGTATPGAYFDDFRVSYHSTNEPVYTPVTLSSDNSSVANYIANDSLAGYACYIDERAEGAGLTSSEGTVEIFDANYNKISAMNGVENHIKVTRDSGDVIFGTMKAERTIIKNEVFSAAETGTKANFNYAKKAFTEEHYEAGIAGKNADDYALTMRTTDAWQDGNDNLAPFIQVTAGTQGTISADVVEDIFTVEFSLRGMGEANGINCLFIPTDSSNGEGWYRPFTITNDGVINLRADTLNSNDRVKFMKTRPGEWVRFALTIYPKTNTVEIYINDNLVQTQSLWAKGENKVSRFKIEQSFSSTGEGDTRSGEFSVDDFRIYKGSRPDMNPVTLNSADESLFDIYNDGDIIFMPNEVVYEDLAMNTSGYGTAKVMPTVFTDGGMTDVLTAMDDVLEDGNVFMVSNDEGLVYEYFYLAEGQPEMLKVNDVTNSDGTAISWTAGEKNLRVHFDCYKDFNDDATVVIAQYTKEGALLSTGYAENEYAVETTGSGYVWPVKASSGTVPFELKETDDYTVKLFVLDGFGSLKPILDVTNIK